MGPGVRGRPPSDRPAYEDFDATAVAERSLAFERLEQPAREHLLEKVEAEPLHRHQLPSPGSAATRNAAGTAAR
ncbi:hypothetical protein ABZZ44_33560 [Streptomyces sp. NPDC006460]|uniref:hypothetical protein n=1 Tax=Streptomyces sp. NPDC006460 TaxID=3154304 RepID=UPI0033A7B536